MHVKLRVISIQQNFMFDNSTQRTEKHVAFLFATN